jgi:hypothetical protein
MGFNTSTWGSINPNQGPLTTGIIWSPYNANGSGGADQGAQINLANPEDNGVTLMSDDQTKQRNLDGTVAYYVTITSLSGSNPTDFTLQGGGF